MAGEQEDLSDGRVLFDGLHSELLNPGDAPLLVAGDGLPARYLRVVAHRLWPRAHGGTTDFAFALAELSVRAGGQELARGRPVSSLDSIEAGGNWGARLATDGFVAGTSLARLEEQGGPLALLAEPIARVRALAALAEQRGIELDALLSLPDRRYRADVRANVRRAHAAVEQLPARARVYGAATHFEPEGNFRPPDGARPVHVLERGAVTAPGTLALPAPMPLPGLPASFDLPPDAPEGARRLALADWLTRSDHPLTWRCAANRLWQWRFGRGLVGTPSDFGRMGELPSHPELLDWLAGRLRDGATPRELTRLLVTSAAYRQVSAEREQASAVDAENRLLWRGPRARLDAETLHDAALSVSGVLDLTAGGPGFDRFAFEDDHSPRYLYGEHDPREAAARRRALYRFAVRSVPDPFLATFDCPDPAQAAPTRLLTTTPLQALSLFNSSFVLACAEDLAARVQAEADGLTAQLDRAWWLAVGARADQRRARGPGRARAGARPDRHLPRDPEHQRLPLRGLMLTRRRFLTDGARAFAGLALTDLARRDGGIGLHHAPKARAVIQLFMSGGASHCDMFDHGPALTQRAGQPFDPGGEVELFQSTAGVCMPSPWKFRQRGESGAWVSDLCPNLAAQSDEIAFVCSMVAETNVHGPGTLQGTTGFSRPGFPASGSWLSWGLGSLNDDLPTFVSLPDERGLAPSGAANWSAGFLPAEHQGVPVHPGAPSPWPICSRPLRLIGPARAGTRATWRCSSGSIGNTPRRTRERTCSARGSRPTAWRRACSWRRRRPWTWARSRAPCARATASTTPSPRTWAAAAWWRAAWSNGACASCRSGAARTTASRGATGTATRSSNGITWSWAAAWTGAAGALLADLKARGLLDEVIVLWTTEFGRMPCSQGASGRDHNPFGYTSWMAGGGIAGGTSRGATDEWSFRAVQDPTSVHDLHATLLHLLGIEHERLTFRHNGVDRRLTDVHGRVLRELLV